MLFFTRAELHKKLWSEPLGPLSCKLGISEVAIRELCTKWSIPRPPRGHWNTVKAGKTVQPTPLPPHDGPDDIRIESAREKVLNSRLANNAGLSGAKRQVATSQPQAAAPAAQPRQQPKTRYITLEEWAELTFSSSPHKNTLLRWVKDGFIQPQPKKIGRRWWVTPAAEYVPD